MVSSYVCLLISLSVKSVFVYFFVVIQLYIFFSSVCLCLSITRRVPVSVCQIFFCHVIIHFFFVSLSVFVYYMNTKGKEESEVRHFVINIKYNIGNMLICIIFYSESKR